MRKIISGSIIIFVVLSSIMTILGAFMYLSFHTFSRIPLFVFGLVYIITITCLILLKNWARITYIIIHIILALFTLWIFIFMLGFSHGMSSTNDIIGALIFLSPFFYSIIAIIYFLRSDTAKLFKKQKGDRLLFAINRDK